MRRGRRRARTIGLVSLLMLGLPAAAAAATGDFDGDGFDDLAVGTPSETRGDDSSAGVVQVAYGSETGPVGEQVWDQDSPDVDGAREDFDRLGEELAAGNFNGDPYDDLAIGIPGKTVGGQSEAGSVLVLYGGASGLQASNEEVFAQGFVGIGQTPEQQDHFGAVLAAGDVTGDGRDELAIAAFQENTTINDAGVVHVLAGDPTGLVGTDTILAQGVGGMPETQDPVDFFGAALAIGNIQGGPERDLVIGVIGEDTIGLDFSGAVHVLEGSAGGVVTAGSDLITPASPGVPGKPTAGAVFGRGLSAGNLGLGGRDDLAVGSAQQPYKQFGSAGRTTVLYGAAEGVGGAGGELLTQATPGVGGSPATGEQFGFSSTIADFGNGGTDDLVVGVHYDKVSKQEEAGGLHVFYGGAGGLDGDRSDYLHQATKGIADKPEEGDNFADSVGAGDFGKNGRADLAIGAPGEPKGKLGGAGAVHLLFGSAGGVATAGDRLYRQGNDPFAGDPAEGLEFFGRALAP